MPDNQVAYFCECGKHWSMTAEDADISKKLKCKCGRTIVVQNGFIYSREMVAEASGCNRSSNPGSFDKWSFPGWLARPLPE